jgi:cytoskeleton protein RodZ
LSSIGKIFQEARESKNLSYQQVEQDLKIKPRYIEAIEEDNFAVFPSVPMARGFIRNYAAYLDLDPVEMLRLYDVNGADPRRGRVRQPGGISFMAMPMTNTRSLVNADSLITFLLIVALLASIAFFAYTQYLEPDQARISPENGLEVTDQVFNENSAAIILPTPTPAPTETVTPTLTPTPQYYTGVTVELVISERSWIQILADDVKVFDGFLEAGERHRWDGDKRIAIRSGNGGGVEVYVNGIYKGFMGEPGQVVDQVWEKVDDPAESEPTTTPTPLP